MKRGKRQVIERANIFGQEEQNSNSHSQISNNFTSPTLTQTVQIEKPIEQQNKSMKFVSRSSEQNYISKNNSSEHKKTQLQKSFQPEAVAEHKKSQAKQISSGDDERKKRLQMLRQRYLKPSSTEACKKQDKIKKQQVENKNQSIIQPKQIAPFDNKFVAANRISYQKQESQLNIRTNDSTNGNNQSTIQTQSVRVNYIEPPKIQTQQQKPKRAVPPPAPVRPKPIIHQTFNTQQQQIKAQQQNQVPQNKIKKVNGNGYRKPQTAQQNFNHNSQMKDKKHINELIDLWLSNQNSLPNNEEIFLKQNQMRNKLLKDMLKNESKSMREVIRDFVLNNPNPYSEQQSATIQQNFCNSLQISQIAKTILLVKCGTQSINKHRNEIDFIKILPQVLSLKYLLLQNQKITFVNYLLENFSITEQQFSKLYQLSSNNQNLNNLVLNHRFQDSSNAALILAALKNHINQQLCPMYFKLINIMLHEINNQQILQQIIKHIAKISFQSAYQLKKDCKLKIIQKIDKIGNQNQNYRQQWNTGKRKQHQPTETNEQKGFGMSNLMGIVNQTFKKIKSQIPQRAQAEQQSNIEQPKQTITWDPVTKRYLINGKIPEDQMGNRQTADDIEQKKNKKVPPPPPKMPIRNNKSIPQHIEKAQVPQMAHKTQSTETNYYSQQGYEQSQSPYRSVPQPPPRAGLKGMANKKPRLQARYT